VKNGNAIISVLVPKPADWYGDGVRKSAVSLFLALASFQLALAQATDTPTHLGFSGSGVSETTPFTIGSRWEVQWSGTPLSITVEQSDGTIVAGATSIGPGSLFVLNGGTYKLRISPLAIANWHLQVTSVGPAGSSFAGGSPGIYVPPDMTWAQPQAQGVPPAPDVTIAGGTVSPAVTTPVDGAAPPISPAVVATPAPPPVMIPPAGTGKLTDAQARAVVVIKGDVAEGTGFLVKTAAGPMVITNQHVIAANPHLQITTSAGEQVKFLGLQGAADRDLAMIPIQDNNYSYLQLATDVGNTVQVGDQVITPGNSEGGEVLLNTNGVVLALGPQKVEISNPIYHGNSGGPVFHVKSGKVIGVVTEAMKVDTDNTLDKASHDNQNSAISGVMRYFGAPRYRGAMGHLHVGTLRERDGVPVRVPRAQQVSRFVSQHRHERPERVGSLLFEGREDQGGQPGSGRHGERRRRLGENGSGAQSHLQSRCGGRYRHDPGPAADEFLFLRPGTGSR
jgi:S1-C subfamily serine protease